MTFLEVRLEGTDVGLIDIIDDNGGNSNDLSRASGHDSHQDQEEHGIFSSGSKQLLCHQGSSKTFGDIFISQHWSTLSRGQSKIGQTHGSCQSEGDGKPNQTSTDETLAAIELDSGPLSETELQILESLTSITSSKLQSLLKEQEMRLELARSEVK